MKNLFLSEDPVDESLVYWYDFVGFTTLNSFYLVYQELFMFSLVDSAAVFSFDSAV